jgi:hypothetical protein
LPRGRDGIGWRGLKHTARADPDTLAGSVESLSNLNLHCGWRAYGWTEGSTCAIDLPTRLLDRSNPQECTAMANVQPTTRVSVAAKTSRTKTTGPAVRATAKKVASPAGRQVLAARKRAVRHAELGTAGSAVKSGIADTLKGMEAIETEIAGLVRRTVASTLAASGSIAKELITVVRDVVEGALAATEQAGTDLAVSMRGVAKGVVKGVHDVRGDVAKAAAETVRTAMKHANKVGADVGAVARRAMDGIVEAVTETGENVTAVTRTAVKGAIQAANKMDNVAVRTVRKVLTGISAGLDKIIGTMPVPPRTSTRAAAPVARRRSTPSRATRKV